MAEAYMLAGELRDCGGDYGAAFPRYEQRLRPFLKRKQLSAAKSASSIALKTGFGIRFRNLVVRLMRRLPFVVDFFIGCEPRDQVELPDYGF
jgi:2-polyprenyl-6-methoxyphenol hydroxylase-like FAD-dependent oxidoreductase